MSSHVSLRNFLIRARHDLQQGLRTRSKLIFVIGNESADLDSLTSSLVYSYIRSSWSSIGGHGTTYIPVTNIPATDIKLRPEFIALLPYAGLEPAELITLDDLPIDDLENKLSPDSTEWVLVDHNVLQGSLGQTYGRRVIGVIDHHEDENKISNSGDIEPRVIERSGSCTSLVVENLKQQWEALKTPHSGSGEPVEDIKKWNSQAARLALASILIDTANLQDENKTTQHDKDAVAFLNTMTSADDNSSFYEKLQQAKQNIGSLCVHDILRKDYKQWQYKELKLGIASVVKPLGFLASKSATEGRKPHDDDAGDLKSNAQILLSSIQQFAEDRKLDMMAVMTTSTSSDGHFQRELLVCAMNESAVRALGGFEDHAGSELKLESVVNDAELSQSKEGPVTRIWQQRAVQHSRKRVAPLLRQAIEENSTSESQL